ncbi:MAG: DUF4214 domain-containing protein, partial [Proteobacteria bacterium]|nr:DUF4214 domain-containing protein [Pseudomonadota bacterium]
LSEGAHTVTVKQSDAAGNVSSASSSLAVSIDTTSPSAPATPVLSAGSDSGTKGDFLTNVSTPVITGTAEANASIKLYDTDGTTLLGTTKADGSGKWSITSSTLVDGSHSLTVKQTDVAGNVSSASSTLTLDIDTSVPSEPGTPSLAVGSDSGTLGDSLTKVTTPVITGTGTVGDTVSLYDTDGTTVLGTAVVDGSGNWSITSSTLSDGVHTFTVKQSNAAGTASSASKALALTIDATAPTAPGRPVLSAGSDSGTLGDNVTKVTTPVITGSGGEANAIIKLYDTDGTTLLGTTTADGSGNWSITSSTLSDGVHTVTVKQTDAAGNVSVASSGLALTIDSTSPWAPGTPALSAGSDSGTLGDFLTNATTPVITGTAEANAIVRLYDTDGTTLLGATKADSSGRWSITSSTLADGSHSLTVKQTDAAGNVSVASSPLTLDIDTSAPSAPGTPVLSAGSDSGTLGDGKTKIATPVITGTGEANATIKLYDTDGTTLLGTTTADSSGKWTITSSTLSDGVHTLSVKQSDAAGNASVASSGLALTIDATAPTAPGLPVLSAGSDSGTLGDNVTKVATPVLTGTGEANATVTLYDTDGTTVLGTTTADGSGKWSIASSTLSDGVHTLTVKQTDAVGNVSSASSGLALTIDSTAPSAPGLPVLSAGSDSGTLGDNKTNATTPVITGTAEAHATIKLYDTDGTTVLGTTTADGSGKWSITSSTLGDGSHSLTVKQTDAAGNVSSASSPLTLNIDTSVPSAPGAPVLAAGSDSGTLGDGTTKVTAPVITGTGTVGDTVALYDTDGTTVLGTAVVDGSGNWSVTSSTLSDGVHSLTVKQTNAAGTASTASTALALTIDATAPSAPGLPVLSAGSDSGTLGDNQTKVTTPVITGTGEANATIKLYDTDGTTLLGTTTADGSGKWSITSSTLSDGLHTITVKQSDAAGNVSVASSGLALTIDSTAPSAPAMPVLSAGSDSGTLGDNQTKVTTPELTGTGEAHATIKLYDTDGTTLLGTTTADGSGKWSITSSTLVDGSHTVTVKQTDAAGNTSVASSGLTLDIDSTAPSAPGLPVLSAGSDTGTLGDNKTYLTTPIVTGTGEAHATVTLYDTDGTTVLGTATADGSGNWSITSSTLGEGVHTLSVKQTDGAGNTSVASSGLALTIEAPPGTIIDGVMVEQTPTTLPGGGSGTQVSIPVVTSDRVDDTGSAGLADIPLVTQDTSTLLSAHVPQGFGLSATGGDSQPAGNSLEHLIAAIIAATPNNAPSDQSHLTGNGQSFLNLLPASVPLLVQTVAPTVGSTAPTQALTLTGTSSDSQHTALVIDASQLPSGSSISLQQVDFAAIIGSASVTGNTSGQILTGDAANQHFTIANSSSQVFAGGGDDVLQFGASPAPQSATIGATQVTTTVLHGGQGSDTAVFSGARADYTIENHDGYVMVTSSAQPDQQTLVINVENLTFSDATVAVQTRSVLDTIDGLYQSVLGRQADYLGMDYWGTEEKNGVSLGRMVLDLINSAEAQAKHPMVFNGDAAHDVELLYQGVFNRSGDSGGLAYWVDAMAHGTTLEQVAQNFATAQEMEVHKVGVQNWDFLV